MVTSFAMELSILTGILIPPWISFSLMKAEQTIRKTVTVPMPNSQGYNVSLFFQDYFPGYKRVKLNLKGVLSGGLPVTAPRKGYEQGYFRTPAYKRVDLGFSYQLAGGTDEIMNRGLFSYLKNVWLGLDVFNLFDMKMENNINADRDGKVIEIKVHRGDSVLESAELVVIG